MDAEQIKVDRSAVEREHLAMWMTLLNACEITPEDLTRWIDTRVFMTPEDFMARLYEAPTSDGVVMLLALRDDADKLADDLARLAAQRVPRLVDRFVDLFGEEALDNLARLPDRGPAGSGSSGC